METATERHTRLAQGSFLLRRLAALARALTRTPWPRAVRPRGRFTRPAPPSRVRPRPVRPRALARLAGALPPPPRGRRPHLRHAGPRRSRSPRCCSSQAAPPPPIASTLSAAARPTPPTARKAASCRGREAAAASSERAEPAAQRPAANGGGRVRTAAAVTTPKAARRRGRAPAQARDCGRRRLRPRHEEGARRVAASPRPDRRRRGRPADALGARARRRRGARVASRPARSTRASRRRSTTRRSRGGPRRRRRAARCSRRSACPPTACSAPPPSARSSAGSAATGSRRTAWPARRPGPRSGSAPGAVLKRKGGARTAHGGTGGGGGGGELLGRATRDRRGQRDRRQALRVRRWPRLVRVGRLRLLGLGLLRPARRRAALVAARLGRLHELRRAGPRPAHHDLRQLRARLHDDRRPPLRHQRPLRDRLALDGHGPLGSGYVVRHPPGY